MAQYSQEEAVGILNYLLKPDTPFTLADVAPYGNVFTDDSIQIFKNYYEEKSWPIQVGPAPLPVNAALVFATMNTQQRAEYIGKRYYSYPYPAMGKLIVDLPITTMQGWHYLKTFRARYRRLYGALPDTRTRNLWRTDGAGGEHLAAAEPREDIKVPDGRDLVDIILILHNKSHFFFDEVYKELDKAIQITREELLAVYARNNIPIYTSDEYTHCENCGGPVKKRANRKHNYCQKPECRKASKYLYHHQYYCNITHPKRTDARTSSLLDRNEVIVEQAAKAGRALYKCKACGGLIMAGKNVNHPSTYIGMVAHACHAHKLTWDGYKQKYGLPKPLFPETTTK